MNITVSLRHGPLDVEIEAEDSEDYKQEILDLAKFLERNEEELEAFGGVISQPEETNTSGTDVSPSESTNQTKDDSPSSEDDTDFASEGGPLAPIESATGVAEATLEHLIAAPEGDDRVPYLVIDDLDLLGTNITEKKRVAALILLFVFHKCYGEDRVASSDLKDAFIQSGVPEDNINDAYNDEGKRFFDSRGRGGSATVALLGPGEREAKKEISRIIDEMDV